MGHFTFEAKVVYIVVHLLRKGEKFERIGIQIRPDCDMKRYVEFLQYV